MAPRNHRSEPGQELGPAGEHVRSSRAERARFRSVSRLIADVTRLGASAEQWTSRLMDGLLELFDAKFAACAVAPLPGKPDEWVRADVSLQRGLTDAEKQIWIDGYWAEGRAYRSEFLRRCVMIPARFVTVRRQDVMNDDEWYTSEAFQLIHKPIGLDAQLESHFIVPRQGRLFGMAVHRRLGAPQYTAEDRRLFRRVHLELAFAWRGRIVAPPSDDPVIASLAPRLRQVLWLLCAGRSEKEVAFELGLSPKTVHNHVVRLHEAFGVHSRGELLARVLGRETHRDGITLPHDAMNQFEPGSAPG